MGLDVIEALEELLDSIDEEIIEQKEKIDSFDITGQIQRGKIQGLEIAKRIIQDLYDEFN